MPKIGAKGWRLREPPELDFEIDRPTVLPMIMDAHVNNLGYDKTDMLSLTKLEEPDFVKLYGQTEKSKTGEDNRPDLRLIT